MSKEQQAVWHHYRDYNQMVAFDSHVACREKSRVSPENSFACHTLDLGTGRTA